MALVPSSWNKICVRSTEEARQTQRDVLNSQFEGLTNGLPLEKGETET